MNSRRIDSVFHSTRKPRRLVTLSAMLLGFLGSGVHGALIGNYEFKGNFDNSVPGSTLPLTSGGGSITENGWYWTEASGLLLDSLPALTSYSIGVDFSYSSLSGYGKIIDFSELTHDEGLYVQNGILTLYANMQIYSGGTASLDTSISLILTRTEDGQVNVYQKDSATTISYSDSGGLFALQDQLNFFLDDATGTSSENFGAGSVSRIRIWDTALSQEEVAVAFEAIPEPGSLSLMAGAGAAALAFQVVLRRRRLSRKL